MEEESPKKKKSSTWPILIVLLLIIATIIFLGWFFTRDKVTTTGTYSGKTSADSINCKNTGDGYPFFAYDNSYKKTTEVTVIFEDNTLSSISLIYTLYYSDASEVSRSESLNHAALNTSAGKINQGPEIFNAHYSTSSENLQLTLSASNKDITESNAKYLLLDESSIKEYNKETIQKNYQNKGFTCTEVNK